MGMTSAITRELFNKMQTRLAELDRAAAVAGANAEQAHSQLREMGCPDPENAGPWLQGLSSKAAEALGAAQTAVAQYEATYGPI